MNILDLCKNFYGGRFCIKLSFVSVITDMVIVRRFKEVIICPSGNYAENGLLQYIIINL
jgi:hypothetical protein